MRVRVLRILTDLNGPPPPRYFQFSNAAFLNNFNQPSYFLFLHLAPSLGKTLSHTKPEVSVIVLTAFHRGMLKLVNIAVNALKVNPFLGPQCSVSYRPLV